MSDVERLFVFPAGKLKAKGVAIIYVSQRMDEIARIADRATIRDGKHVITAPLADLPIDSDGSEHITSARNPTGLADVARGDVSRGGGSAGTFERDRTAQTENVSFALHRGEVLGLAGLLTWSVIWPASLRVSNPPFREIRIKGAKGGDPPPSRRRWSFGRFAGARSAGDQGIIPPDSVADNMVMSVIGRIAPKGSWTRARVRDRRDMIAACRSRRQAATMRYPRCRAATSRRWQIGKWLCATEPGILILDEPTARDRYRVQVRDHPSGQGTGPVWQGVIVISSGTVGIVTACDRILVMADGRAHQMLDRAGLDDPSGDEPEYTPQAARTPPSGGNSKSPDHQGRPAMAKQQPPRRGHFFANWRQNIIYIGFVSSSSSSR